MLYAEDDSSYLFYSLDSCCWWNRSSRCKLDIYVVKVIWKVGLILPIAWISIITVRGKKNRWIGPLKRTQQWSQHLFINETDIKFISSSQQFYKQRWWIATRTMAMNTQECSQFILDENDDDLSRTRTYNL